MIAQAEIAAESLLEITTPSLYTADRFVAIDEPSKEIIRKYSVWVFPEPEWRRPLCEVSLDRGVRYFQHSQLMANLHWQFA